MGVGQHRRRATFPSLPYSEPTGTDHVPETVDAIVVGAGVAGLTVARALTESGRRIVVLEARDRVGGRLRSVAVEGGVVDLGATWYWASEPRVCSLVAELGLACHDQHILGDALYQDSHGVHRLEGNPIEGPALRLTAGMEELAKAMARTLPTGTVHLSCPVTRIRSVGEGLMVEFGGGARRAAQVVLALAPALAVALLEFEPKLSDEVLRLASSTPVWMGAMTKVVMRYEQAFWRDRGLAGAVMSQAGPMHEIHDMSGPDGTRPALFGFVPPTHPGSPLVTQDEILVQLRLLFGVDAPAPTEVLIRDWRAERYTSPEGVESLQAYETYGHPSYARPELDGRLHWASTETAQEAPGHIEGALAAGKRAAAAVLSDLAGAR